MAKPKSGVKSKRNQVDKDGAWDPSDTCDVPIATLIEAVKREKVFAYDLETTGLNPRNDRIEGVAFYVPNEKDPSRKPIRAWYPFTEGTMDHTVDGTVHALREPMPQVETMEQLRPVWQLTDVIAVRHNGIFDDAFLYLASGLDDPLVINNIIADSMLADYVADERRKRYGLKLRVDQVFGHKMTTYNEAVGGQAVFGFAQKKPLGVYACDDTAWTYRLWKWAMEQIRLQDPPREHADQWCSPIDDTPGVYSDLEKIYWKIEMRIQRILMEMELTGCFIDWEWLVTVQERIELQKKEIEEEFKEKVGWMPNLRSPKQVSDFLYRPPDKGGLGLPTKGVDYNEDLDQYATGDKAIKHRKEQFPLVSKLLKYRSLGVIESSFCHKLIKIAQEDPRQRVHARFRQTGTVIGRLSSADPVNLMNQPRDKDLIRKAFCAHLEDDFDPERSELCLIDADYGQMELRMAAHLANERNMIEVYSTVGGCSHGENGEPCERYTFYECFQCHKKAPPRMLPNGEPSCQHCEATGDLIEHQKRCRHVDLHQRTSEDVGVPRNPLAKCLDGSTMVVTQDGPRSIDTLIDGEQEPGMHHPVDEVFLDNASGGWVEAETSIVRHNRPTKIIVTKRSVVIATNDHRFQVYGDGLGNLEPGTPGYLHEPGFSLVEAEKLEKGMRLPPADFGHRRDPIWHEKSSPVTVQVNPFTKEVGSGPTYMPLNEDWAYFAGMFIGDGCASSSHQFVITHGSSEDFEPWRRSVRESCWKLGLPAVTSGDKRDTKLGSRVVYQILSQLGLAVNRRDGHGKTYRVPDWVIRGGPKIVWSFIAGLWDTDGSTFRKDGVGRLCTKSPELAGQVAFLLRWLGVAISISPAYNKRYKRYYYTINVLANGLNEFARYLPLRHPEKIDALQARVAKIKCPRNAGDDEVLLVIDGGERTVFDFHVKSESHLYMQQGLRAHNNANFGLLYRMGAPKFCVYAGLFDENGDPKIDYGQSLIDRWHQAYPGIATWHERTIHQLVSDNYIAYNIAKRRRRLDIEWKKNEYRAGTQAIQFRVSGSCQDLIKLAMIRIFETRNKKIANSRPAEARLWKKYKFLIQVHDELIFEGPKAMKEELCALVKDSMEGVAKGMRVPFVADARAGRTWDELH